MHTILEPSEMEGVARREREEAAPSRLMTTLYELLAAIQDAMGPDDDTLMVATMRHFLWSGQLTWLGQAKARLCPSPREAM
jgi:hypothetical protein